MAAAPAQQALAPFWGHPDSNIDWCEHNYEVTPYVAEFWNAVSSVPILLLGVYGFAMQPIHLGDRRFRFIFTLLGLVGVGSFMFHATLRIYFQFLDELPMIYGNLVFVFDSLEHRRSRRFPFLEYLLALVGLVVSLIYLLIPQLYVIFLASYSLMLVVVFSRTVRRCCEPTTPPLAKSFAYRSWLCYFSGVALWVLENTMCHSLPRWWKLHAVWHVLAGLGTYFYIEYTIVLRCSRFEKHPRVHYALGVPYVSIDVISAGGSSRGSVH